MKLSFSGVSFELQTTQASCPHLFWHNTPETGKITAGRVQQNLARLEFSLCTCVLEDACARRSLMLPVGFASRLQVNHRTTKFWH